MPLFRYSHQTLTQNKTNQSHQSLDSVKELPGVAADEQFLKELQGKRLYFQALK